MQLNDIRLTDPARALNATFRASSDTAGFSAPPLAMSGDRAQIRNRRPSRPTRSAPLNLTLGWAALAFALFAAAVALGIGQLGGMLGLLLGWMSAAFAYAARREIATLADRVLR